MPITRVWLIHNPRWEALWNLKYILIVACSVATISTIQEGVYVITDSECM